MARIVVDGQCRLRPKSLTPWNRRNFGERQVYKWTPSDGSWTASVVLYSFTGHGDGSYPTFTLEPLIDWETRQPLGTTRGGGTGGPWFAKLPLSEKIR